MKNLRRAIAAAIVVSFVFSNTACFGSFNLTRKLWGFNNTVSPNKWIKWLAFLGLSIVQIYTIAAFVDAIVLNSIEFWSGQNPVTSNEVREDTRVVDGRVLHTVMTSEHLRIEITEAGKELQVFEISVSDDGAIARDGSGQLVSQVKGAADGSVVVSDGDGRELFARSGAELEELSSAVRGGSPFLAVFDSQEHGRKLASAR